MSRVKIYIGFSLEDVLAALEVVNNERAKQIKKELTGGLNSYGFKYVNPENVKLELSLEEEIPKYLKRIKIEYVVLVADIKPETIKNCPESREKYISLLTYMEPSAIGYVKLTLKRKGKKALHRAKKDFFNFLKKVD